MFKSIGEKPVRGSSLLKAAYIAAAGASAGVLTDEVFNLRNALPEPFDYAQHASSVTMGVYIGGIIGTATTIVADKFGLGEKVSHGRLRTIATAAATVVGLAVNAAFETRTGMKFFHLESLGTPDMLDLAYGVGSSAISGAITPSFQPEQ